MYWLNVCVYTLPFGRLYLVVEEREKPFDAIFLCYLLCSSPFSILCFLILIFLLSVSLFLYLERYKVC